MCHHSFSVEVSFLHLAWKYSENRNATRKSGLAQGTQPRLCVNTMGQVCGQQRGFKAGVLLVLYQ